MRDVHAGDRVLDRTVERFHAIYDAPSLRTQELLTEFLKPKLDALRPRKNETAKAYKLRFFAVFSGAKWVMTRRRIAEAYTNANVNATKYINDGLEEAFADGMNDAAYALALSGVAALPITVAMVSQIGVKLNRRTVKKSKDTAYNAQRLQTAVHAAVFKGITVNDLPKHVARVMSNVRKNDMTATARAVIYGASDYGEYLSGIEAERSGIDVEKTWLAIMDMNVRPSHKHLHGVTIPIREKFHGYHGDLRYPHDPLAHPAEIYNCRCRMVVHIAGKAPDTSIRRILPTETAAYRKWRDAQIRKAGGELELMKLHRKLVA